MSLLEKISSYDNPNGLALYERFGVLSNPFPSSNQTSENPHRHLEVDDGVENLVAEFIRDGKSQVLVVIGTQGVGKTNFLNHFESEIRSIPVHITGYYLVRYLADPEASFEGTTRRLFEEFGQDHLRRLRCRLSDDRSIIDDARSHDMRTALRRLAVSEGEEILATMMEWLLGLRLLKRHREVLGVLFRLDTVESKTAALRDLVQVSGKAGVLNGIFLLLDELEKQDGVLGPTAIVRYLSALRAIVDALPNRLFLMIAITPDALRRYSAALPALRGRLQNQIELKPLANVDEGLKLAEFYVNEARQMASRSHSGNVGERPPILGDRKIERCYQHLERQAKQRADPGVRQREFLHELHLLAERAMQSND